MAVDEKIRNCMKSAFMYFEKSFHYLMEEKAILMRTCSMTLYDKAPVICNISPRYHLLCIAISVGGGILRYLMYIPKVNLVNLCRKTLSKKLKTQQSVYFFFILGIFLTDREKSTKINLHEFIIVKTNLTSYKISLS